MAKEKANDELTAGLEIHQQLDTKKLFCECPSILRKEEPDFEIDRKLHVVAGETGEVDIAVKHEATRGKQFVYQGYDENVCLVELDEEPPHMINQDALKIALQISLLLNCEIIPYTQIMRKTVIDGSNTSGFQRTVLIAKKGHVGTSKGKVRIQSVALEEDAARIVKQEKDKTIFRLDRLGIPLVEIATQPDIHDSEAAKEAALKIGDILRSCKVKRGIGTIRQDVNVSVKTKDGESERIEIKGVQEPALIVKTINTEAKRQKRLVKQKKSEAEVRKALPDGKTKFLRPLPGAARMYPETDLPLLHISRMLINDVKKDLPRLKSELREEIRKKGVGEEIVKVLVKKNKFEDFQELLQVYNKPELIAKILTVWMSDVAKKVNKTIKQVERILTLDVLETIIQAMQRKKIAESDIYDVMKDVAGGAKLGKALEKEKIEDLEEEIMKIVKKKPGLSINAYMGLVMQKFKGRVSGKQVVEILKKYVE